jgi:hypothetical protein
MPAAKLQIVFALTTTGLDVFATMTRIAVASLRHTNPDARILIACDQESMHALRQARHPLLEEVDGWHGVATPSGSAELRNRHVKTNLRELVDDRFLFLDSDVFVSGSLESFLHIEADIAVAPNHSQDALHAQIPMHDASMIERLAWPVDPACYVNGGVVYYNDTEGAHSFASNWHRRWKYSAAHLGEFRDQPALNAALFETRPAVHHLKHEYNYQLKWDNGRIEQPVIWHYNYTSRNESRTHFEDFVDALHRGADLDRGRIAAIAAQVSS